MTLNTPQPPHPAQVYIIDDDPLVRDSLEWLLQSVNLPAQTFESGQAFLDQLTPKLQGCVILDVRMPGRSGLDIQGDIQQVNPDLPVIIVTGHADVPMAIRAMKAGAFEFIEKPYNDQFLLERIQNAIETNRSNLTSKVEIESLQARFNTLSKRETQVLQKVLKGTANKVIAHELFISIKTVEAHRANLMQKLQVKTVAELVHLALKTRPDLFETKSPSP